MKWFYCLVFVLFSLSQSQPSNILLTNQEVDQVLKGNFNGGDYAASNVIRAPEVIVPEINQRVLPDSLESYLTRLVSFHNRNTGSDTSSSTRGIGAARRWVYSKFQEFSAQNEGRLLVSYFQFNETICSRTQHRNVLAVLPGSNPSNHSVLIVEGHMDSRCENVCDINCQAHGADDNGSGAVLVMELARVLSRYTFEHTLVFADVIGEEQGLYGSNALAQYFASNNINVIGVQNNDVSGGIECGPRSSPPSCPPGGRDSTHIRIFSSLVNFSDNKAYARYVQLQHQDLLNPILNIPMTLNILDPSDRTGRGGDHQSFSDRGIAAIRFTESYEHGDGSPGGGNQHTTNDIIGEDPDNNGSIDYYYVNFPYLARNTKINGVGLAMAALSPPVPAAQVNRNGQGQIQVAITSQAGSGDEFLVGVRTNDNDFDFVFRFTGPGPFVVPALQSGTSYYISAGAIGNDGVESLFSQEVNISANADGPTGVQHFYSQSIEGLTMKTRSHLPGKSTVIHIWLNKPVPHKKAELKLTNIAGRQMEQLALQLKPGLNEATLQRRNYPAGVYHYSLLLDDKVVKTNKVILSSP